jgi:hypothetical protein
MDWTLPPASKNLRRHGDSQTVFQAMLLGMALVFWIEAKIEDGPIMAPEIYGDFVTQYPAEWWAASLMLASGCYLAGILINGNWRWSPALRLVGALWHVTTMALFVVGGMDAKHGTVIMIWGASILIVHLFFTAWNVGDLTRAVRNGRG